MAIDTKKYGTQPLWRQFGLPFDVSDYQSTIDYLDTLSDGYVSRNVPEKDLQRMLGVLFKDKEGVEDLYKTASPEYWGGVYEHKLQPSRADIEGRLSNLRKFGGLETPEKGEYLEGAETLYKQSKTRAGRDVLSSTSKQMSLIDTRLDAIMNAFQALKESEYSTKAERRRTERERQQYENLSDAEKIYMGITEQRDKFFEPVSEWWGKATTVPNWLKSLFGQDDDEN